MHVHDARSRRAPCLRSGVTLALSVVFACQHPAAASDRRTEANGVVRLPVPMTAGHEPLQYEVTNCADVRLVDSDLQLGVLVIRALLTTAVPLVSGCQIVARTSAGVLAERSTVFSLERQASGQYAATAAWTPAPADSAAAFEVHMFLGLTPDAIKKGADRFLWSMSCSPPLLAPGGGASDLEADWSAATEAPPTVELSRRVDPTGATAACTAIQVQIFKDSTLLSTASFALTWNMSLQADRSYLIGKGVPFDAP